MPTNHNQSTNGNFEPNAGGKYNQLGDSTTAAVLDGTVRAILGADTFILIDLGPNKLVDVLGLFCA